MQFPPSFGPIFRIAYVLRFVVGMIGALMGSLQLVPLEWNVLPFLNEAATVTNITSQQVVITSQIKLCCRICGVCLVLCNQCISTGTMHTIGKHTKYYRLVSVNPLG